MSLSAKLRRAPLRAVTGAFILNTGISKLSADDDTANSLHGMATGTYPFFGKVQPKVFAKGLAAGEIAIGTALLLPIVPPVVAGAALAAFSGGLLNMYWRTPGMHEEGNPRPTRQGTAVAKDVWMFGIGTALVADGVLEPLHDKKTAVGAAVSERRASETRRASRKARKAARRAQVKQAAEAASAMQAEYAKRARKAAKEARKRAAAANAEYGPTIAEKAKQAREVAADRANSVTEKAKQARDAAADRANDLAEKAQQARDAAADRASTMTDKMQQARDAAADRASTVAEKAQQARDAVQQTAEQARERVAG
jgi:hypothetical protein